MGYAQLANTPPVATSGESGSRWQPSDFRFESLTLSEAASRTRGLSATLVTSVVLHVVLISAVVILPLLLYDAIPDPGAAVRAFFVAPAEVAPPPPPPPPPAAGPRLFASLPPPRLRWSRRPSWPLSTFLIRSGPRNRAWTLASRAAFREASKAACRAAFSAVWSGACRLRLLRRPR